MAATTAQSTVDHSTSPRASIRTRPPPTALPGGGTSSPRTPLLGRSISSQFGSPGSFRVEQEDFLIYELSTRYLAAGFAGESRPRCVVGCGPEDGSRPNDYRRYEPGYKQTRRVPVNQDGWTAEHELFSNDLRNLDLGLVEDRLERLARKVHVDFLQLDNKPRKAVLSVPTLLPTPILEIVLRVLFSHHAQPPSIMVLTAPVLACASAGLRNALVVDLNWEETVVTAVGEYKIVNEQRSVRAERLLTSEVAMMLQEEEKKQQSGSESEAGNEICTNVNFESASEVTQRLTWCESKDSHDMRNNSVILPLEPRGGKTISIPFNRLSEPTESAFFADSDTVELDDHNLPIHVVAYNVLLALPPDLRALCMSRVIVTGNLAGLPGIKRRILQELSCMIKNRGWNHVESYGSAGKHRKEDSGDDAAPGSVSQGATGRPSSLSSVRDVDKITPHSSTQQAEDYVASDMDEENAQPPAAEQARARQQAPRSMPQQTQGGEFQLSTSSPTDDTENLIPPSQRGHDDKFDHISMKAEREAAKGKVNHVQGIIRRVETLGAWCGASLVASLRVKAACEIEREDFLKHGLRDVRV